MSYRVVDHRRWHRTKIAVAVVLFVVAVVCAGGFESQYAMEPMPSFAGFITAIGLLTWLTINIVNDGER